MARRNPIAVDRHIADAAGRDAGNRSMRAAGRTAWDRGDWDAACDRYAQMAAMAAARREAAAAKAGASA